MNFMELRYKTHGFSKNHQPQSYQQIREVFRQSDGPVVGLVAVCVSRWRGFCKVPVDGRGFSRPDKVVQTA